MIKAVVFFALDIIEYCIPGLGSVVMGLITAPITIGVSVAEQVGDLVERFKKGGEITEKMLNSKYGEKIKSRLAQEYPLEVADIITGRAAASYVTMIAFGKQAKEGKKSWQIENKLERLPFEVISEAHGEMLEEKHDKSKKFYVNQAMSSMTLPLDVSSLALAAGKELPVAKEIADLKKTFPGLKDAIDKAATGINKGLNVFGDFMFGVNLVAGAKEIVDAFKHGKCPLNKLPKRCADEENPKNLCGKHGKCHPTEPWMCICGDGKTKSSCGVNPKDLVEYAKEADPTERELDELQRKMQSG